MDFLQIIYTILRFFTMPVELFLRRNFGERYINVFSFILPSIGFAIYHELSTPFNKEFMGLWVKVFFVIAPIAGVGHMVLRKLNGGNDDIIHSHYSGIPLIFPNIKETLVKFYIEPLLVLVIGCLFYAMSIDIYYDIYGIGLFLMLSGILLFFRGQMEYSIQRTDWLDSQDEYIEKNAFQDAIAQKDRKDAKNSQGFAVPGPLPKSESVRENIGQIYNKLNPKLKDLMGKKKLKEEIISKSAQKSTEKEREL